MERIKQETDKLCTSLATALGEADGSRINRVLDAILSFSVILTKDQASEIPSSAVSDLISMTWAVLEAYDNVYEATGLVPLCSNVFEMLLNHVDVGELFLNPVLFKGLKHTAISVKKVVLNQILRSSSDILKTEHERFRVELIKTVVHEDVGVGTAACAVFSELAVSDNGLEFVLHSTTVEAIHSHANNNFTALIRVMCEVYVQIVAKNASALVNVVESGAFKPLVDILKADDVLAKMAILESMSDLARSTAGYHVLSELGLIAQLSEALGDSANSDFDLLAPIIVNVFALLSQHADDSPARVEETKSLLSFALSVLSQSRGNTPLDAGCLDAVKMIGQSPGGVALLTKFHVNNTTAPQILEAAIYNSNNERGQVAAMSVLAGIFAQDELNGSHMLEATASTKSVENLLTFVLERAKLPFPDVSEAALDLIEAMATRAWGREALLKMAGFYKEITNRSTSSHHQRERKFKICKILLKNPRHLSDQQQSDLRLDISRGAHEVQSDIGDSVMTEFL